MALVPEPDNPHDGNAVAIYNEDVTLQRGYVPAAVAPELHGDEQAVSLWRVDGGLRVLIAPSDAWSTRLARLVGRENTVGFVNDPPYRIVSERLVIRCWEPRDAGALKEAIDSSLDQLRPWMPWARAEPQPVSEKVSLLRRFRGQFDLGTDFVMGIFDEDERRVLGGTGLHKRRSAEALEIGYWIRSSHVGRGMATESSAALTRVAFELCDVDRVEIRIDPANEASLPIPRKLGFVEEGILRRRLPPDEEGVPRDVIVFSLFRDGFVGSPASSTPVRAFDAGGERVL